MRLYLHSTTQLVLMNGQLARIWEGRSDEGVEVLAVIPHVVVVAKANTSQFERELIETAPPFDRGTEHNPPSEAARDLGKLFPF